MCLGAAYQDVTKQGQRWNHTWSLTDLWTALPWV